eukprot:Gb_23561 [translate_table: standard]
MFCGSRPLLDPRLKPHAEQVIKCPRCDSSNTKFCYYNNYSLTQPRHFCKTCRRYWTNGGSLRTVPVGGGCRKNKRAKASASRDRESAAVSLEKNRPSTPPPATTTGEATKRLVCTPDWELEKEKLGAYYNSLACCNNVIIPRPDSANAFAGCNKASAVLGNQDSQSSQATHPVLPAPHDESLKTSFSFSFSFPIVDIQSAAATLNRPKGEDLPSILDTHHQIQTLPCISSSDFNTYYNNDPDGQCLRLQQQQQQQQHMCALIPHEQQQQQHVNSLPSQGLFHWDGGIWPDLSG